MTGFQLRFTIRFVKKLKIKFRLHDRRHIYGHRKRQVYILWNLNLTFRESIRADNRPIMPSYIRTISCLWFTKRRAPSQGFLNIIQFTLDSSKVCESELRATTQKANLKLKGRWGESPRIVYTEILRIRHGVASSYKADWNPMQSGSPLTH